MPVLSICDSACLQYEIIHYEIVASTEICININLRLFLREESQVKAIGLLIALAVILVGGGTL